MMKISTERDKFNDLLDVLKERHTLLNSAIQFADNDEMNEVTDTLSRVYNKKIAKLALQVIVDYYGKNVLAYPVW